MIDCLTVTSFRVLTLSRYSFLYSLSLANFDDQDQEESSIDPCLADLQYSLGIRPQSKELTKGCFLE